MSEIGRAIDEVIRVGLAPALKAAGFRRQARTFRRAPAGGAVIHVVNVQGGKWNAGADGQFTVNLGAYLPAVAALLDWPGTVADAPREYDCHLRQRIGLLMPGGQDHWWDVTSRTDLAALGRAVADAYERYGAPWLDGIMGLEGARAALEASHDYYPAAAVNLALGDRAAAARLARRAIERAPHAVGIRDWARRHGLYDQAAV